MNPGTVKRRVELQGFKLLELKRIDGRRFIVLEPSHGLLIRGDYDAPLTLEEVSAFIEPFEHDPFTCEPL